MLTDNRYSPEGKLEVFTFTESTLIITSLLNRVPFNVYISIVTFSFKPET